MTKDGLLGFSHECAGLNFILVPADLAFALLFTSEDYNLYAGPRNFVECALGTSIASAGSAFQIYADDPWWQGRLLDLHRYYDSIGEPRLAVGPSPLEGIPKRGSGEFLSGSVGRFIDLPVSFLIPSPRSSPGGRGGAARRLGKTARDGGVPNTLLLLAMFTLKC